MSADDFEKADSGTDAPPQTGSDCGHDHDLQTVRGPDGYGYVRMRCRRCGHAGYAIN